MTQMNEGGKFIFEKSLICDGFLIQLPLKAIKDYSIATEGRVYQNILAKRKNS